MNRYSVAYCNPQVIAQSEHYFRLTKYLRDQIEVATTDEAKEHIKKEEHNRRKNTVAMYISRVIRKWKDKNYIMCPYGFDDHWILIVIQPKRGLAVVLDSADYPHEKYAEFIEILHKFIHREICHEKVLYYSDESKLAKDKCHQLRNWDSAR
ncbi:hypothetical protein C2845_PM10G13180 [Panicum miliaceum]|uniref:Ubiquitin-like protease family profile domain-containing protein n=1 Tax=Panicum miliaceum TaxID=4540 RepID=A0A3L6PDD7_PANMI|nr:hypothetical protein C2845_PM10G13180 [Panicum miliaceum]